MGKVQVLDKHTAELIAAGEVVERPSSVVKELIENSIDAGASAITVEIKGGGVRYIRITDDGEGIAHDDVPVAFLRHATSKIRISDDLDSIATLGFRGEALASIAAVSRVELITRTAAEETGTHFVIEGGEQITYDECGCAKGTTIVIRDIFYNTPARMKFLKKDVYEGNAVATIIDRIALSHPEISIRLIREGKQTLMTSGDGSLKSAVYSVYGREFAVGMIPVDYTLKNIRVTGFISKPTATRPNRSMQVFFINNRYCRSATMQTALEQAYKGAIMVGKHPSCVLNVEIDCSAVDVNVHPAKMEVRFTNERPVFEGVYYAIKTALGSCDERREASLSPSRSQEEQRKLLAPPEKPLPVQTEIQLGADYSANEVPAAPVVPSSQPASHIKNTPNADANKPVARPLSGWQEKIAAAAVENQLASKKTSSSFHDSSEYLSASYGLSQNIHKKTTLPRTAKSYGIDISADDENDIASLSEQAVKDLNTEKAEVVSSENTEPVECIESARNVSEPEKTDNGTLSAEATEESSVKQDNFSLENCRIIGEAFETYIIVELGNELILIDKHAAHERLIYEKLISSQTGNAPQQLLEPITVTLEKIQYEILLENNELLEKAGFEVEDFGPGTVIVRAVPMVMCDCDISEAIMEIADNLTQGKMTTMTERLDNMYHTMACRSAIKAHDRSVTAELEALVRQLAANTDIRYCPHGRPISITITKRELEKNFGRV